jgi:hypothetical protein
MPPPPTPLTVVPNAAPNAESNYSTYPQQFATHISSPAVKQNSECDFKTSTHLYHKIHYTSNDTSQVKM